MDFHSVNDILKRTDLFISLKDALENFEKTKENLKVSRGFYIYGSPGCGKTHFVNQALKELNYKIIKYDSSDVRNKGVIENLKHTNSSDVNVFSMFYKKVQKNSIIMDEIDGMNSGDKGGLSTLIKLIRPKKTVKQKKEDYTNIPFLCIGDNLMDKKTNELMKVCSSYHLEKPSNMQIMEILNSVEKFNNYTLKEKKVLVQYIDRDLRKLNSLIELNFESKEIIKILLSKTYNLDAKLSCKQLYENKIDLSHHDKTLNENDRTTVGLIFHENIIHVLPKKCKKNKSKSILFKENLNFYLNFLKNCSFADHIDRIIFQKQIWLLNELSSLIKNIQNNNLYFEYLEKQGVEPQQLDELIFTKVLTKYSTEYNNKLFIYNLCENLNIDPNDVVLLFMYLEQNYEESDIYTFFEEYQISKLEIQRFYRFIHSILE